MNDPTIFAHPSGIPERAIRIRPFELSSALADHRQRCQRIPDPDPYYVDLGMLYRFAALERVHRDRPPGYVPLHIAVRGHMGTGKDHDIEQFAARLRLPYYRIPMTGEVRDLTLIGSTRLHGDGKGGTESRWEDGDITRALRGPALINLSELNAAGAETLFALHGLLDRFAALDLPTGETIRLRNDVRIFGTMNPTDLRDYAGTQTLNKAFADRWVIWEKSFPTASQVRSMLELRYPAMTRPFVEALARLTVDVNASFESADAETRVETPMSLRGTLDRLPTGLRIFSEHPDPLRRAWEEFVLPRIDPHDRDHYETVWRAVVRQGPKVPPYGKGPAKI